jgi:hypothetical protein
MKREIIESMIGKRVRIIDIYNEVYVGTLQLGDGFSPGPKWYNVPEHHISFRASHIKKN